MSILAYRQAEEDDMRFVRHSWVESYRTSHYAGPIPMSMYFKVYHDVVKNLMERDGVKTMIAYHKEHPSQIFGFCCYEKGYTLPLVHYIYVKSAFRQLPGVDDSFDEGIATMLLEECGIDPTNPHYYTFKTGVWAFLASRGNPFSGGIFKPLLTRFDKDEAAKHEAAHFHQKEAPKEREETPCYS